MRKLLFLVWCVWWWIGFPYIISFVVSYNVPPIPGQYDVVSGEITDYRTDTYEDDEGDEITKYLCTVRVVVNDMDFYPEVVVASISSNTVKGDWPPELMSEIELRYRVTKDDEYVFAYNGLTWFFWLIMGIMFLCAAVATIVPYIAIKYGRIRVRFSCRY